MLEWFKNRFVEYIYTCTCTEKRIRLKEKPNFDYCPYCGKEIKR